MLEVEDIIYVWALRELKKREKMGGESYNM
jgi:hypothetical protein